MQGALKISTEMKRRAAVGEGEMRRATERFREMARKIRENPPPEPIDPAILEEIRRGAEPFERAIFQVRKRETGGMEKP